MMRVALALVLTATPLAAQATLRVPAPLLAAPNGRELATIRARSEVRIASGAGTVRQGHTQVTLDGFIDGSLLGSGRDSFPTVVKAPSGARLRGAARSDAPILADLRDGMGLTVVSRAGRWARVRRTAWVATGALESVTAAASPGRAGQTPPAATPRGAAGETRGAQGQPPGSSGAQAMPSDSSATPAPSMPVVASVAPPGALTPAKSTEMRTAPQGSVSARIDSGAFLTPLARDNGWTRVRIEGWVRDDALIPADSALRLSLSGADVRADPDRYKGTVVRWDVEFIAIQRADQLRRDLRSGEPYILARGPGKESGLLYIAVPPALLAEVERYEPLQVISITGRIRVGRSEPAGVPVLDLISAVRR